MGYCLFALGSPEPPVDKRIAPHFLLCISGEEHPHYDFQVMSLTYKVLKIQESPRAISLDGSHLTEVLLTDLNSEERFQIWVVIVGPNTDPITGIVFDGPENWRGRIVAIHHSDDKTLIEQWKEGDWLIDENPMNK